MAIKAQGREDDVDDADLEIARFLGSYHDRLVEGLSSEEAETLLESHPDLAREIEPELDAIAILEALVEIDLTGRTFGDFRILRELGRGATGIVYEAFQASLARHVALKVLLPGYLPDQRSLARFLRGAQLAASISHPNVVGVFAAGEEGGMPYFAMEYAQGETLHALVERLRTRDLDVSDSASPLVTGGRSDCLKVAEAFAGAADGLQAMHSLGIIHRDLKPANLIAEESGRIRILDFGLARFEGQDSLTMTLERLGTPLYMSPEQASGPQEDLTPATDIFSLGATLYEVLVLRPPFDGRVYQEIIWKVIHKDAAFPRRLGPRIPRDLERIVLKCMRKRPTARYGTAEALSQDLRRFVRGDPVEADDEPVVERLKRRVWRARWTLAKAAAAALAIALLALAGTNHLSARRDAEQQAQKQREKLYEEKVSDGVFLMLRRRLLSPPQNLLLPEMETVSSSMESGAARAADASVGDLSRLYQAKSFAFRAGPAVADLEAAVKLAVKELEDAERILPERPEARYHLAKAFQQLGESEKALQKLEQAIERQPGFTPALALRAAILDSAGDPAARRAADLVRASLLDPRRAQAWIDSEKAWFDQDWQKAEEAYDQLGTDDKGTERFLPAFVDNRIRRALVRLKSGALFGAFEDLAACVDRWPGRFELALLLGKVRHLMEHEDEAERIFERLHASVADSSKKKEAAEAIADAYRDLGDQKRALRWIDQMAPGLSKLLMRSDVLSNLRDHAAAISAARGALQLAPRNPVAVLALANALIANGQLTEAKAAYGAAAALDPGNPHPLLGNATCLEREGDLEGARKALEEALLRRPGSGEIHYNLGRLLSMLGRDEDAIVEYRSVSDLEPVGALAHLNLGTILDRSGRYAEAIEQYERTTELSPRLSIARYNLGWAYQRERRFKEAAGQYQEAIRQGLLEAFVYARLGMCLQQLHQYDSALKAYEKAIQLDPKDADAHHAKAICYYWMGDFEGAVHEYLTTLALDPDKGVRVLNELGDAFEMTGDTEQAVARWRKVVAQEPKFIWAHNSLARVTLQGKWRRPEGEDLEKGVIRLEDAADLHNTSSGLRTLLEEYRKSPAPRLVSFASVDAKLLEPEVLVEQGSVWSLRRGTSEPSAGIEWTRLGFEDSAWEEGTAAFGTPEAPGVRTPLSDMEGGYTSIYLRQRFQITDVSRIQSVLLKVRCDAGYVVYLNGKEVFRASGGEPGAPVAASATAEYRNPLENGFWTWDEIHLEPEALLPGENILALQGLRYALDDGLDFRIDAMLATQPSFDDTARRNAEEALKAFRTKAHGPGDALRITYFDARLLQLSGEFVTALMMFRQVHSLEHSRPEPVLRIAECMAALGHRQAAGETLRSALESGLEEHNTLWDAWFALQADHPVEEILENFPRLPPERPGDTIQHPMQIDWLLRELSSDRRAVRINCGGAEYVGADGRAWGRDRFFRGGQSYYLFSLERLEVSLPDGPLHWTERFFRRYQRPVEGYYFPLPNGRYRLSLHFTEGWYKERGQRIFDVLVQGESALEGYEPVYGVPDVKVLGPIEVTNGFLRIDFLRRVENPKLSAIEIERI